MLKKIYHTMVVVMLLLGTTGVTISQHYCHGNLVSASLLSKAKSCCGSDCPACQDKTTIHRLNDDFVNSVFVPDQVKQQQLFHSQISVIANLSNYTSYLTSFNYSYQKAPPQSNYSTLPEYLEVFRC